LADGFESDVLKLDEATVVGQAETPASRSVCLGNTGLSLHTNNPKSLWISGSLKHGLHLDYKIKESDEPISI
jgi:hypothetical protein